MTPSNPNPISDVIGFLTTPAWTTGIFWALLAASVGIAVYAWGRIPEQRAGREEKAGENNDVHVDDPDQPAARLAIGKHLHRGAVLLDALADRGIDQPPPGVVAIDQELARHRAVGEGHDAGVAIEASVGFVV